MNLCNKTYGSLLGKFLKHHILSCVWAMPSTFAMDALSLDFKLGLMTCKLLNFYVFVPKSQTFLRSSIKSQLETDEL